MAVWTEPRPSFLSFLDFSFYNAPTPFICLFLKPKSSNSDKIRTIKPENETENAFFQFQFVVTTSITTITPFLKFETLNQVYMCKQKIENIEVLQKMVNVSDNSLLTQKLCWNLCDNLHESIKVRFFEWLVVVENKLKSENINGKV